MARLTAKLGTWNLPHVHMWKDRELELKAAPRPILKTGTRIATIGSCFAAELAAAMDRFQLDGAMHPGGLFYTTRSIRQEVERIFGGWPQRTAEPLWRVKSGYVHPFCDYSKTFASEGPARAFADGIEHEADVLFHSADVIVITLGLIEAWRNPQTDNYFRQIPHPDVFEGIPTEFVRLSVADMQDDLSRIVSAIRRHTSAKIILTVSPIPLHATMTAMDVRIANAESKSRIRAAVSEFVESHPDVGYFHSYEIVTTAERASDFMLEDGRHLHRHAVDYVVSRFVQTFGARDLPRRPQDVSWLTRPSKTAARPAPRSSLSHWVRDARKRLNRIRTSLT